VPNILPPWLAAKGWFFYIMTDGAETRVFVVTGSI